ncbi:hypothetical protein BROUX41_006164 [Berkeleyomyces rouxiae]|uniref:uncharacterized protein n=1 Tax=Berkeleyomyces rouxiae TaxID=2035830 RepID=UPI003B7C1FCF
MAPSVAPSRFVSTQATQPPAQSQPLVFHSARFQAPPFVAPSFSAAPPCADRPQPSTPFAGRTSTPFSTVATGAHTPVLTPGSRAFRQGTPLLFLPPRQQPQQQPQQQPLATPIPVRRIVDELVSSSPVERVPESEISINGIGEDVDGEVGTPMGGKMARLWASEFDDVLEDTSQEAHVPVRKKRRMSISEDIEDDLCSSWPVATETAEDLVMDEYVTAESGASEAVRRGKRALQPEISSGSASGASLHDEDTPNAYITDAGAASSPMASPSPSGSDLDLASPPTTPLHQPTFQRAPRFHTMTQSTQSTDPDAVPALFSPPNRRQAKAAPPYRPHGLAAAMQGWLAHVRGLQGDEESVRVVRVRCARKMVLAEVVREHVMGEDVENSEKLRVMLAGGGGRDLEVVPGCLLVLAQPTWWVAAEGGLWLVVCDWHVVRNGDEEEMKSGHVQGGDAAG